jgi:hypothetical protein
MAMHSLWDTPPVVENLTAYKMTKIPKSEIGFGCQKFAQTHTSSPGFLTDEEQKAP